MVEKIGPVKALERARLLFGCYRRSDAADPETFAAAIAAVLAEYDERTVADVTHPLRGLPARTKFVPSVSELIDECERVSRMNAMRDNISAIESDRIDEWRRHGLEPQYSGHGLVRKMTDYERAHGLKKELPANPEMAARAMRMLANQLAESSGGQE